MRTIYFVTDEKYISKKTREGGVKLCTQDYIDLLSKMFQIKYITLFNRKGILYKTKKRIGIDVYEDYSLIDFKNQIDGINPTENIVFALNMTNTIRLAQLIKNKFGTKAKVILLSHGNESGDFIHQHTRFAKIGNILSEKMSSYKLGRLLKTEALFRMDFIDLVLTVSEIEVSIEKWLNAKKVFFVPRTINTNFLDIKPTIGKIGFLGDLSHAPNHYAITSLCEIIERKNDSSVNLSIIGGPESIGKQLSTRFTFVKYGGYLEELDLQREVSTWSAFLNIAFYYSRGVSTKLGKALGLGLPVINTKIALRGYKWKSGELLHGVHPEDIYQLIKENCFEKSTIQKMINNSKQVASSTPSFEDIMKDLSLIINDI